MQSLNRQTRRVLSATGLVHSRETSVRKRSLLNTSAVWEAMRGKQCVLWMDNFYKMCFGVNPGVTDCSVNATAMAVMLNVRPLGAFRGYGSHADVVRRLPLLVRDLVSADHRLRCMVRNFFGGIESDAIRVPLDVPRGRCTGHKWRPFR